MPLAYGNLFKPFIIDIFQKLEDGKPEADHGKDGPDPTHKGTIRCYPGSLLG
jgi:hypothetical protein